MYVFIKLHITAQSGPVILVILCHSHRSSQGGINVCACVFIIQQSMDQPDRVSNPASGQLIRENEYSPVPVRA